jgi:Complex 1 protein (LYR family)
MLPTNILLSSMSSSSLSSGILPTRSRVLSLYRQLLRQGQKMPTPNRQNYVLQKARKEFKAQKHLIDPDEILFYIRLADTNLDTVIVQAEHLTKVMSDPNYKVD